MAMECVSSEYKCYLCPGEFHDVTTATNHLKSHLVEKGENFLKCMKARNDSMFCKMNFKSLKTLRQHMKNNKCKLFSIDVNIGDENSQEGWNCVLDTFGSLNVDDSSSPSLKKENEDSMADFIESFVNRLVVSNMPHYLVSDVIGYSKELICKASAMNKKSMKNIKSNKDAESILDTTENVITSCLNEFGTRYRRRLQIMNSPNYIAPNTINLDDETTIQYVSLLSTLNKLFVSKSFRDMYFTYNENHTCRENIYERYCCGRNFKESDLFQSNRNNIQIQIFYDDVQVTSPLSTRPHKICGIYFIIRNLPPEFVSKLDNMYLVTICNSKIEKKYGCNSILEHLVREIKILETDGISIDNNEGEYLNLKGTLVQVSFDNLGGNTVFGLVKCFRATYYCRICICTNNTCKKRSIEVAGNIRTKEHYIAQIMKILESPGTKLKVAETFGISTHCVLNDLNFYHTIDNRSQDIMHDIYEGAMPLVLKLFFNHLITKNNNY